MPIVLIDLEANNADWQLLANMVWPNNPEMRANYLVTQAARAKQKIKDEASRFRTDTLITARQNIAAKPGRSPLSDREEKALEARSAGRSAEHISGILAEIEEQYFEPHGGDGRLTRSPGIDTIVQSGLADGALQGRACGEILWNIITLHQHHPEVDASYNVAERIMRRRADLEKRDIPNWEERRRTMWREHGRVAPLWAAYIFCKSAAKERGILWRMNQWLVPIVSRSLWFADFAVGFKATKARRNLLTEDQVIRVNPEIAPTESILPPFDAGQLAWVAKPLP